MLRLLVLTLIILLSPTFSHAAQTELFLVTTEPIQLNNVEQLQELTIAGHGNIDRINLSPDSTQLAVVNRLGIYIHDLSNPTAEPRLIGSEYAPIMNSIFGPDWSWVAISTPIKMFTLDVNTGEKMREFGTYEGPSVHAIFNEMVLSSNGRWLATTRGLDGGEVNVWDIQTGDLLFSEYHRYTVGSPVFGPDNRSFAYTYYELCLDCPDTPSYWYIYDTQTWDSTTALDGENQFGDFSGGITAADENARGPFITTIPYIASSPSGKILVSEDLEESTQVWDAESGEELYRLPGSYRFRMFSPDGRLLIFDTTDQRFLLLDPITEAQQPVTTGEQASRVAFDPDGKTFAVADTTGIIRIVDVETHTETNRITSDYLGYINDLAFAADGSTLYFTDARVNLRQLDFTTGEVSLIGRELDATGNIAYSPTASLLALGTRNGSIQLWNVENGEQQMLLTGHEGQINDLAFSPDGLTLVSSATDKTVRLWDVTNGSGSIFDAYDEQDIERIVFSPDGTQLLAADSNNGLGAVVYDLQSRSQIVSIISSGWYANADYSSNGQLLAVGGYRITLWQTDELRQDEPRTEIAPQGIVYDLKFNPGGDLLFTSSTDAYIGIENSIAAWNVANGDLVLDLREHPAPINALAFTPNGRYLALGGLDGTIRLWGIPSTSE